MGHPSLCIKKIKRCIWLILLLIQTEPGSEVYSSWITESVQADHSTEKQSTMMIHLGSQSFMQPPAASVEYILSNRLQTVAPKSILALSSSSWR
jgi:hypothetical protein